MVNGAPRAFGFELTMEDDEEELVVDPGYRGTSRWRRMSMDTLRGTDDPRRAGRPSSAPHSGKSNPPCSLTTEGIALSTPAPLYKYLNRGPNASPTLTKNFDDVEGTKPRPMYRKAINRSFHSLTTEDIKGSRPDPKFGKKARGTCPLTPEYKLPSYEEPPPYEPKFLKDSMDLSDIDGSRPSSRISSRERDHMNVTDIEGSAAGWRPAYRRNFGKSVRDLCLQVHDINPPKYRYVRDPHSEVYEPVQGSHPKRLIRPRSPWSPIDSSLRTNDIEGTSADSALLRSKVKARKQKSSGRNMVTTQQEKAELVAVKLLKTKVLDQMKGKSAKEVVRAFKRNDRQASGKLTIDEVENAFRSLDVGLNAAELRVFSTAFDSAIDGYINYWHLVKHLVPITPSKRKTPGATKVIPMALQGWSQTEEPRPCYYKKVCDDSYVADKMSELANEAKRHVVAEPKAKVRREPEAKSGACERTIDRGKRRKQSVQLLGRERMTPVPIGGPFWPEQKLPRGQPGTPKSYLSLFHDHHEPPKMSAYYRILDDSEKRWTTTVGENLYTGEGNTVCSTSYTDGSQWRPPSSQRQSRCSTLRGVEAGRPWSRTSTRPSTAMSLLEEHEDSVLSRTSTAGAQYPDENMGLRRLGRPQSASAASSNAPVAECLRSISSNISYRPFTAGVNPRCVRSRSPFSKLIMPHGVQRQLSQMMEDIEAVKALR